VRRKRKQDVGFHALWRALPMLLVAWLLGPASFSPPPAWGFVQSLKKENPVPLRWEHTNCIKIQAHASGLSQIGDGSEFQAVRSAVESWQNAIRSCSYMQLTMLSPSPAVKLGYNKQGENESAILWIEKNWTRDEEHDDKALALTSVFYIDHVGAPQDGILLDADIEINGEHFEFSTNKKPGTHDLQNTLTHELGHVLGLDHPCYPKGPPSPLPTEHTGQPIPPCSLVTNPEIKARTMYATTDPNVYDMQTPEADDILGICTLYPKAQDPGTCGWMPFGEGGCDCRLSGTASAPGNDSGLLPLAFLVIFLYRLLSRGNPEL
jgi:hypothetical protein